MVPTLCVSWAFNIACDGDIDLTFRYRSQDGQLRRMEVFINGEELLENDTPVVLATTQTAWQERTVTVHNLEAETYIIEVKEIGIEKRDAQDIDSLEVTVLNAPDTSDRGSDTTKFQIKGPTQPY